MKKIKEFKFEQDTRMNLVSLDITLSDWAKRISHRLRGRFCNIVFRLGGLSYNWFPLIEFLDNHQRNVEFVIICGRKRFTLKPRQLGLFNVKPEITVQKLTSGSVINSNNSFSIQLSVNDISFENAIRFVKFLKDKTHRDLKFSIKVKK